MSSQQRYWRASAQQRLSLSGFSISLYRGWSVNTTAKDEVNMNELSYQVLLGFFNEFEQQLSTLNAELAQVKLKLDEHWYLLGDLELTANISNISALTLEIKSDSAATQLVEIQRLSAAHAAPLFAVVSADPQLDETASRALLQLLIDCREQLLDQLTSAAALAANQTA